MLKGKQYLFNNKNILVTGGTGSIGTEIVKRLLRARPNIVRIFSNDENAQFNLQQELKGNKNVRFLLGDIRDKERLKKAVENIDIVFHAAALKHVTGCEYNPFEAIKTNVIGTQNIIEAAIEEEVEKLITISTDKAVNTINVMGATKLLAERLTISANYYKGLRKTIFSCVRFGNVLDSRGSVVSIFKRQIQNGGPVTITDPKMTRFIISLPRAVDLVLEAGVKAKGGEIFIFKMPAVRIGDFAEAMILELASKYGYSPATIKLKIVGKREGEKNYEELLTYDEAASAYETEDMFIIVAGRKNKKSKRLSLEKYISNCKSLLSKNLIRKIIKDSIR